MLSVNIVKKRSRIQDQKVPILEFRLLLGLPHVTYSKKLRSCAYNSETSLPLKIFATNEPPGRKT